MKQLFLFIFIFFTPLFSQNDSDVYLIQYAGAINPVITDFIKTSIDLAEAEGGECLIIELDTPGGLMKSMQEIVKDIMAAPIPVIVYVSPAGSRAGSAGVFITYAAHVAAMAPGTNIGAAHPVTLGTGGGSDSSSTMMDKVTNDAVAFIKSIAEKRGRNQEWAEAAVRESASIPASEAFELNVVNVLVSNVDSLLLWLDGREIELEGKTETLNTKNAGIVELEMSLRLKVLNVISDPNIAYILLLIGIYGIFFELYNPGTILPGVVGGISLILAFYALHTLPVNYAGLLLILFSIILFVAEIKVPSYGMLTVGGIVSLVFGSLLLFKSALPIFQVSWKIILAATLTTVFIFVFAMGFGIRALKKKSVAGKEGLIGESGKAITDFKNLSGQVEVHGEIWQASSDKKVKAGEKIKVIALEGLKVVVKKET